MKLSRNTSLILGGCTALTYLVGSIIPVFLMDRFGRRTLLMVSAAGLSFCFVMAAILLSIGTLSTAYAAVAFVFIFQIFLGVGWLPVPWFYPSEINTTRIRSKGMALASAWNWLAVFAIVKITPIAIGKPEKQKVEPFQANLIRADNIGWRTFIIFAVFNACWVPIVYCFFPETKGLTLEDIDLIFAKGGITGGVFSSKGRTVQPNQHSIEFNTASKAGCEATHQETHTAA